MLLGANVIFLCNDDKTIITAGLFQAMMLKNRQLDESNKYNINLKYQIKYQDC